VAAYDKLIVTRVMGTLISSLVEIDENGVAWVVGANTKVTEIVLDTLAHGSSPQEIHFQHPHLSLAQIHAALAFYYEHKAEVDAEIQRQLSKVEELARNSQSPLRERLSQLKNHD
jgi:uncharacterized protein (DUF433 family)